MGAVFQKDTSNEGCGVLEPPGNLLMAEFSSAFSTMSSYLYPEAEGGFHMGTTAQEIGDLFSSAELSVCKIMCI